MGRGGEGGAVGSRVGLGCVKPRMIVLNCLAAGGEEECKGSLFLPLALASPSVSFAELRGQMREGKGARLF